jgi:hypothetical protein
VPCALTNRAASHPQLCTFIYASLFFFRFDLPVELKGVKAQKIGKLIKKGRLGNVSATAKQGKKKPGRKNKVLFLF